LPSKTISSNPLLTTNHVVVTQDGKCLVQNINDELDKSNVFKLKGDHVTKTSINGSNLAVGSKNMPV